MTPRAQLLLLFPKPFSVHCGSTVVPCRRANRYIICVHMTIMYNILLYYGDIVRVQTRNALLHVNTHTRGWGSFGMPVESFRFPSSNSVSTHATQNTTIWILLLFYYLSLDNTSDNLKHFDSDREFRNISCAKYINDVRFCGCRLPSDGRSFCRVLLSPNNFTPRCSIGPPS